MNEPPAAFKFSRNAINYFRRLSADQQQRILEGLQAALQDPLSNSSRLVNRGGQRKIRVGDLRVLFYVESQESLRVDVITPRGQAYDKRTARK